MIRVFRFRVILRYGSRAVSHGVQGINEIFGGPTSSTTNGGRVLEVGEGYLIVPIRYGSSTSYVIFKSRICRDRVFAGFGVFFCFYDDWRDLYSFFSYGVLVGGGS